MEASPNSPAPTVPAPPFDVSTPPRTATPGAGTTNESSPSELARSRENSVHGPVPSGSAVHHMTPEMQLAMYPNFLT